MATRLGSQNGHPTAALHQAYYPKALRLGFYRGGLQLALDRGGLVEAETWPPTEQQPADASFPELTFPQLLFAYRSLAELEYAFPDCRARMEEARVLLDALFPRQPSWVWPVA